MQFFFCCCFFISFHLVFASGDEVSSLLSIKDLLIDPSDQLGDWKLPENGSSHCNWTGISCNSKGFVETLDLSNMNLTGQISDQIGGLLSLAHLNICCNGFSSPMPKSLSTLVSLKTVDLSQNNFVGGFPVGLGMASALTLVNASSNNFSGLLPEDLGNATSLETLDFRGSFFVGSVPASFSNLQNLNFLGLSGNNLTGQIPAVIGQLLALETIILGYNEFVGPIPSEFGNLTNLRYLDLAVGTLSGPIPPELGRLPNLETVYLYQNSFEGEIPKEIGNISSLVYLDLSDNQLSGQIPSEIADLSNLQLLNLMTNQLTGQVPQKIGELTKLQVLELWQNSLTGPLPASLGQNSPLQWLDVSSNSLSGQIPVGLCNSGILTKLILFNNSFSGPIPTGLSSCHSLVRVRVQNNLISGPILTGFGNLTKLQRLEMSNNNLSGSIPQDFALSSSLSFIDVSGNNLVSTIPSGILSLVSLQNFLASNNNMRGNLPDQFNDCPTLSVLDLSGNHFSGNIPESIASCERLVTLNLRNNQFTGAIPTSIATMPTLAVLDLSNNSLTGNIPVNFGSSPALESLNLSYNRLVGEVPDTGMLATINPNDLIGNAGLCGGVLPPCGSQTSTALSRLRKARMKHVAIGFVVVFSVILALGLVFLAAKWLYKKWYLYSSFCTDWYKWRRATEWPWRLIAFQRLNFTSAEILSSIKESNVIGQGSSGIVYKAEVHRPYSVVAVKKLWRTDTDIESGDDLFGEVNLLGRLRHRNIVRLLGYLHNENDAMMVYEYMPNGNLAEALHGKHAGKMLVDWVSRYNIAVGVAHGLAYLHHDCRPPVIHRDVKSNNILLDANFEARIADFGLARTMVRKNETVSMVAGSYGYIAPEYGYTLKVDEKSDIYSFGVVLLELITGKLPLDPRLGDCTDIVEWVRAKIRRNRAAEEALDPSISGGQCQHVQEEMLLVLRIALLCTAKNPKERPSMRDIITMLGEAKPRRKSVCLDTNSEKPTEQKYIDQKPIFTTESPVVGLL
ncbi:hypothetical protein Vadar_002125 [Vaccinium darrowii]|uniref:Uncharacterized protein n=1 Tax=Vaccinium darrowii TaxID=229202 RepID=A0ACB7ZGL1_9ERIC|nr:hypothetical protein Vadar_002125 [Vaccinium darrowii]